MRPANPQKFESPLVVSLSHWMVGGKLADNHLRCGCLHLLYKLASSISLGAKI